MIPARDGRFAPLLNCSRHSKVISNWYLSINLAGLLDTLTFSNEMIDMAAGVVYQVR